MRGRESGYFVCPSKREFVPSEVERYGNGVHFECRKASGAAQGTGAELEGLPLDLC